MALPVLFAIFIGLFVHVSAYYDLLFFSGNGTCPDFDYNCSPPQACAHDALRNKYYCCGGVESGVCWTSAQDECDGDNGSPSGAQSQCGSGDGTWCCLKDSEECTQTTGQIDICWAQQNSDPLGTVSDAVLKQAFYSLSSANPSASTYSIDSSVLASLTATSTSSSSASTSSTSHTSSQTNSSAPDSSPNTPASTGSPSSSISGGAIAGIVIGAIAGIAVIAAAVFFILRQRRKKKGSEQWPAPSTHGDVGYSAVAGEKAGLDPPAEPPTDTSFSEMATDRSYGELPSTNENERRELLVEPNELPGSMPGDKSD